MLRRSYITMRSSENHKEERSELFRLVMRRQKLENLTVRGKPGGGGGRPRVSFQNGLTTWHRKMATDLIKNKSQGDHEMEKDDCQQPSAQSLITDQMDTSLRC